MNSLRAGARAMLGSIIIDMISSRSSRKVAGLATGAVLLGAGLWVVALQRTSKVEEKSIAESSHVHAHEGEALAAVPHETAVPQPEAVQRKPRTHAVEAFPSRPKHEVHTTAMVGESAKTRAHYHPEPSPRLQRLLGQRSAVRLGRLKRTGVDTTAALWVTHYTMLAEDGTEVELTLPGGSNGDLMQRVGHVPAPEDGAEIALNFDEAGRPVWAYHRDGELSGGSLEFNSMKLR